MDITQIAVALIGLLGIIITSVGVPYIKAKTTTQQWDNIVKWTDTAVNAAEVIYDGAGRGAEKEEYVIDYVDKKCAEKGIKFNSDDVLNALKNSWKLMVAKEKQGENK